MKKLPPLFIMVSSALLLTACSEPSRSVVATGEVSCEAPPPKDNAEIIFLSGRDGSGLSTVAVTGPDKVTEVSKLVIGNGTQPLYIMATSRTPMIWSFEGNTKRVEKFVIAHTEKTGAGVGVVGLTQDRIKFLGTDCLDPFSKKNSRKKFSKQSKWRQMVGKRPDWIISEQNIISMHLPSGKNKSKKAVKLQTKSKIEKHKTKGETFNLYRYQLEGLIEIDLKNVIAPKPVHTYDVYPQEAGIIQLVESGHLKPMEQRRSFRVVKRLKQFPAGLYGAHSIKFYLRRNMKMPDGDPGHSSVYVEKTGECLSRSCR